jgi:hypothetical protein
MSGVAGKKCGGHSLCRTRAAADQGGAEAARGLEGFPGVGEKGDVVVYGDGGRRALKWRGMMALNFAGRRRHEWRGGVAVPDLDVETGMMSKYLLRPRWLAARAEASYRTQRSIVSTSLDQGLVTAELFISLRD